MKEKIILTKQEARELIWEDLEGFEVISDTLESTTRWSELRSIIIQRVSDGKYFRDSYQVGLTEIQEEKPFENTEPDFTEVERKVRIVQEIYYE